MAAPAEQQHPSAEHAVLLCGSAWSADPIRTALAQLGYRIAGEAGDTETALHAARRLRPEIVLVDADLPPHGGSGTTLRMMRQRPIAIVVAGEAGADWAQRALEAGASGYLAKPLRTEDLGPALLLASSRFTQLQLYERLAVEIRETNERLLIAGLHEQQTALQFQKVAEVARGINAAPDVEAVLQAAVDGARDVIGANLGGIRLTRDAETPLQFYSLAEQERGVLPDSLPDPSQSLVLSCGTNCSVRLEQEMLRAIGALGKPGATGAAVVRGLVAAPLIARNGTHLGVLWLTDKRDGEFSEQDETILVQLAQIASGAVDNALLSRELEARDRAKDRFLAVLAHELRNPLAPILNTLEVLRIGQPAEPDVRGGLTRIERQARQIVHLVDDLMDMARITRDRIQLRKETLELSAVVDSAVDSCRVLIEDRKLTLTLSLPDSEVHLEGDPTRLQQVLGNLLTNAVKYTDPGGRIWITAAAAGDEAVIRVRDTGVGIPAELRPRLFDLFVQADQGLAHSEGGLGIGLALVRKLVELHGGTVSASSEGPGQGSEFTVRLPLGNPGVPDRESSTRRARTAPLGLRVLIVEDNRDAANTLAELIQIWGHSTRVARDGHAALAIVPEHQPQVVLLDIGLPGMDGYEVARRLRQLDSSDRPVLVALTGYSGEVERRLAQEAAFDHYLVKPVAADELQRILGAPAPVAGP